MKKEEGEIEFLRESLKTALDRVKELRALLHASKGVLANKQAPTETVEKYLERLADHGI